MADQLQRLRTVMGDGAPLFYDDPIEVVRGDGVWLHTADGDRYLDLYNNVPCVGHANPRVADAIAQQMATLNVHSRYVHDVVLAYAERLVELHHDGIESVVLACSGTEAVEIALMMARAATGNRGIICTDATYHGNSTEVSKMTRLPVGRQRGAFRSITTPDRYRPIITGGGEEQLLDAHLEELAETIAGLKNTDGGFAGMMFCSILANEGLPNPPRGWFERICSLVRSEGGLIIADEVQAGFARSGSWWGYQTSDFEPDIVCMGKPMGNGLPVSGVAAGRDLVSGFRQRHRYFNTFASSPVQAAAGNAVIDEIEDRGLVAQVDDVGRRLRGLLGEMQSTCPAMGDVRGHGLFIGIDWVAAGTTDPDPGGAKAMVEALKERRMLVGTDGRFDNVVKIRPPLVLGHEHADLFVEAFADAIAEVGERVTRPAE